MRDIRADSEMRYDVFLSHNRQEKPWVRRLYQFLVQNGLAVFFDEVSVPPGADFVATIEGAVSVSKNVALILSPGSLESRWVAMETQLALMGAVGRGVQSVVPILLDEVDLSKVRPVLQSLNWIDLRDATTRESKLRRLLHHFGVANADSIPTRSLDPLLWIRENKHESTLRVAGVEDVIGWGWNGVQLLEELIKLDYGTNATLTHIHEGDPTQWGPIFMDHPDTWRMLIAEPKKIVGYWHIAPLFNEDYAQAKSGKLLDSEITSDRVQHFEIPGVYDIYFVQVCLSPEFRKPRNTQLLFETFFETLEELSKNGIIVREVTTNALTPTGISLCKTFNMSFVCEHEHGGSVYCAPIAHILRNPLVDRFPELRHRYAIEGAKV